MRSQSFEKVGQESKAVIESKSVMGGPWSRRRPARRKVAKTPTWSYVGRHLRPAPPAKPIIARLPAHSRAPRQASTHESKRTHTRSFAYTHGAAAEQALWPWREVAQTRGREPTPWRRWRRPSWPRSALAPASAHTRHLCVLRHHRAAIKRQDKWQHHLQPQKAFCLTKCTRSFLPDKMKLLIRHLLYLKEYTENDPAEWSHDEGTTYQSKTKSICYSKETSNRDYQKQPAH